MLSGKLLGYCSGRIVNRIGFTEYFVLSACAALPAIGLYFWLRPRMRLGAEEAQGANEAALAPKHATESENS
jgi:PAT family beta-lactamase induction signal transducer AmpG